MAKLEKYTKQTGAFSRPMWREVPDDNIIDKRGLRTNNVKDIVVPVLLEDGTTKNFQGDEISQTRLTRWIIIAEKKVLPNIQWKTFENKVVTITINDAVEILYQAGLAQTALWF